MKLLGITGATGLLGGEFLRHVAGAVPEDSKYSMLWWGWPLGGGIAGIKSEEVTSCG